MADVFVGRRRRWFKEGVGGAEVVPVKKRGGTRRGYGDPWHGFNGDGAVFGGLVCGHLTRVLPISVSSMLSRRRLVKALSGGPLTGTGGMTERQTDPCRYPWR